jgi:hypothetical protein
MATQAQITANRRNARRSTGPRTAAGKRFVGRNALKHGLRSTRDAVPGEDTGEFRDYCEAFTASVEPRNEEERVAALRVARPAWSRRLLYEAEARALSGLTPLQQLPKLDYLSTLDRRSFQSLLAAIDRFDHIRELFSPPEENAAEQTKPIQDRPELPLAATNGPGKTHATHSNPISSGTTPARAPRTLSEHPSPHLSPRV